MPSQEPRPPTGIPEEDWAATPLTVRALVVRLLERVAQVEARLNQTSRISSTPPSADPPSAPPRAAKAPSGRKPGGQLGHLGQGRPLKPVEEVDRVIEVRPESCAQCGTLLLGDDPTPERHQVTDLPRIEPIVTEYRRHTLGCGGCGATTQAAWPVAMPSGSFGPGLQATVGYLTGRMGASQREVHEVLAAVCHTEVSVGSIAALEQAVSTALAAPVAEAARYVQHQPVRNADETGWREQGKRVWLWISATSLLTLFRVLTTRGAGGAKALLGEDFWGIVGTDRDGTLLREGAAGAEGKTERTCRNLVKLEAALWTFVWEAGVEPTNNNAERPLRRAVLWRRRSFGTQSGTGSQFVERILTAVTTLRQQRRDVLEYLTAACAAAIRGEPAPSLLPITQSTPFAR